MTEATARTEEPEYLKVSEVARQLNLSLRQVYDLVSTRELASSRFGIGRGAIRVHADSLADFRARRRETP